MDITNLEGRVGPPQLFKSEIASQLVQGVWSNATTPVRAYRSPLLESSWFRTGKSESIEVAEPTYRALARTPFVSLYGSSNWYDDVAELVSCYYLTQELDQPYRIVLSKGTETLFSLNPTDSELVIRRFGQISALFPK